MGRNNGCGFPIVGAAKVTSDLGAYVCRPTDRAVSSVTEKEQQKQKKEQGRGCCESFLLARKVLLLLVLDTRCTQIYEHEKNYSTSRPEE